MIFDSPISITEALRSSLLRQVLPVGEDVGSFNLQELDAEVKQRAFFSARTPYADYLQEVKDMLERMVQPDVRVRPGGTEVVGPGGSISPAQVRAKMKQRLDELGYEPDPSKAGTLQDLGSDQRINLIMDTQLKMMRGYGNWRESQNPVILSTWPAQEMYRAIAKEKPRPWARLWNEARRNLGEATSATVATDDFRGPFIALKNDPIWTEISYFKLPYPPFHYNSGMRVRDVGRRAAIQYGVLQPGQTVQPRADGLNDQLTVNLGGLSEALQDGLRAAFGDQAGNVTLVTE